MKPVEVTLSTPVFSKGVQIEKLQFRAPTLGDARALKMIGTKEDEADNAAVFAHILEYAQRLCMTQISKEAFDMITIEDSYKILEAVMPLFGKPSMGEQH